MNKKTTELIPLFNHNNELLADSRLLHQKLKIASHHKDWIRRRINEYGFVEGIDFRSNLSESTGGRKAAEYLITIDMAKELNYRGENEIVRVSSHCV